MSECVCVGRWDGRWSARGSQLWANTSSCSLLSASLSRCHRAQALPSYLHSFVCESWWTARVFMGLMSQSNNCWKSRVESIQETSSWSVCINRIIMVWVPLGKHHTAHSNYISLCCTLITHHLSYDYIGCDCMNWCILQVGLIGILMHPNVFLVISFWWAIHNPRNGIVPVEFLYKLFTAFLKSPLTAERTTVLYRLLFKSNRSLEAVADSDITAAIYLYGAGFYWHWPSG